MFKTKEEMGKKEKDKSTIVNFFRMYPTWRTIFVWMMI